VVDSDVDHEHLVWGAACTVGMPRWNVATAAIASAAIRQVVPSVFLIVFIDPSVDGLARGPCRAVPGGM
jgi:hypothetical protein